jgi:hypothetical protein
VYFQHWSEWIAPMLAAAGIYLAAVACCCLPVFLVLGPLACGLYACALGTLQGRPPAVNALWRGWPAAWSAVAAFLVTTLLTMLPTMIVVYGPMTLFGIIASTIDAGGPNRPGGPPETWMVGAMFGCFALMMVGSLLGMVWTFWINTRTMFVMLLITDRGMDFPTAWRTSWQATRRGFWELLLVQFLAGFIGGLGIYAFYVGVLFTMPIYFTIIAAAYQDRLGPGATVAN